VNRFVQAFFVHLQGIKASHPKWRDFDITASVTGWTRYPPAEQWITQAGLTPQITTASAAEPPRRAARAQADILDPQQREASHHLMRVPRPIAFPQSLLMAACQPELLEGAAIGAQSVGDDHPRRKAVLANRLSHELERSVFVSQVLDQHVENHALESPGEPRSEKRPSYPECTKRVILSTISSAKPPASTAATLTATERTTEIAAVTVTPTPVPAAPPPSAAPKVLNDFSAPKPEANPGVARLEVPKDTSPIVSASPNERRVTPNAVILLSQLPAATAETAPLLSRGDSLFGMGDVASARLFYERAADIGNGEAALRLGKTYDPYFLEQVHARGVRSDLAVATRWYQRARDLGAREAESLMKRAENK
jgi:hypothetical protein